MPRSAGPFVTVNCAAFPDDLLESELFGYERGAFTGAASRKMGRFDQAQGGTLLLDEIGEMKPLLRVLQEREYIRLGGTERIQADVRVVSATHVDMEANVRSDRFREDLYYRLTVFTVELPPLRERIGYIPLLALTFVAKACPVPELDPMVIELLSAYSFPGNVRQLENAIRSVVVMVSLLQCRI